MHGSPHEKEIISYLDRLHAFAASRLADKDLAADAVQESVTKALRSARKLRDVDRLQPWLYTILRNTMADLARKQGKEIASGDLPERPASNEMEDEVCHCFRPLIASLPSNYGEVVQAVDLENRSREEVAAELNINVQNLNVKLHRGRQSLRRAIEATCKMCAQHGCLNCTCESS